MNPLVSEAAAFFIGPNVAPLLTSVAAILKSLAWPICTGTIAYIFRVPVVAIATHAARKVTVLKAFGVEASFDAKEQAQAKELTQQVPIALEANVPGFPDSSPALSKMEKAVQDLVEAIPSEQRVARLTRSVAQQALNAGFAIVYINIFGSQIKGLIELSARRKVSAAEALLFFQPFLSSFLSFTRLMASSVG